MKRTLKKKIQIAAEMIAAGQKPDVPGLNHWRQGTAGPRRFTDPIPPRKLAALTKKVMAENRQVLP